MGKFKSYDFGRHGAEGLSHGGEIWGSGKNQAQSKVNILVDYDRNMEATTAKMVEIARNYYANKDIMSREEIASNIVRFQQNVMMYEKYKKDFYKEHIDLDYDMKNDNDFKVFFDILNDMREKVRQMNESNGITR